MNMTQHEFNKIKEAHNAGMQLTRHSISKLINEVEIAKQDVRVIEVKISEAYAEKANVRGALKVIYELADHDEYSNTLEQVKSIVTKALEETE